MTGTLGNNGWHVSDATVSWTVDDPESAIVSSTGCDTVIVISDTSGDTFTCTAESAGGTASQSVTVKLDKTGPSAALAVTAGTLGSNGWHTSDVTISTTGTDSVSGPVTCAADQFQTAETIGFVFNGSCANDAGLVTNAASLTVKLDKTAPTIAITSPVDFAVESVGLVLDFSATDNISGIDTSSANVDDGTVSVPVLTGESIDLPGVYTLEVTATDLAGNQATESHMFVIYDPNGGFATGGGWIIPGGNNSDPGDILPGIDGTSKATFGFVVKYKNGAATTPKGQLQFRYHVGDFKLHSADYEWLMITNTNWAKFRGLATIDGSGDLYPFHVDARDGDHNGGNQTDRFVIKIWAPGADPDVDDPIYKASGDLGGGKIKIHN